MARTTLVLEDSLLREIKKRAAVEDKTLQRVVTELLRRAMARPAKKGYRLGWKAWKAELQPGVDIFDRDSLFEAMDREPREGH